jgi:hypothetical protein
VESESRHQPASGPHFHEKDVDCPAGSRTVLVIGCETFTPSSKKLALILLPIPNVNLNLPSCRFVAFTHIRSRPLTRHDVLSSQSRSPTGYPKGFSMAHHFQIVLTCVIHVSSSTVSPEFDVLSDPRETPMVRHLNTVCSNVLVIFSLGISSGVRIELYWYRSAAVDVPYAKGKRACHFHLGY